MKQSTKTLNLYDEELMSELIKGTVPMRPAGFGVTVQEYRSLTGASESAARRLLLVKYKREYMRCANGRGAWVYFK